MTKYNPTSINSHINQRLSFCWTIFHYFRSGSLIHANSAVMCLRELELDTLCAPGIIPRDSFRSLPSFSRRYSFVDPCGGQTTYYGDTDRFLQDSPIASLLADRVPRQVTLNTTRPIALHLSIVELYRFRDNINNEHRSYCAIKGRVQRLNHGSFLPRIHF